MLSLYEELFLLSVDDEKGVSLPSASKALSFGLAGAVLAELALQKKIRITDKQRLEVIEAGETGDKILDNVLKEVQASDKPRKLGYWVEGLSARPKKLRKRVQDTLVARGVIGPEDEGSLEEVSPSVDAQPVFPSKYEIKSSLRAMILADGSSDLRSLALLNAARASGLLNLIFTKDERRLARRCIREKVIREALGNPVAQAIEEIEEAVSAAYLDANS